MFRSGNPFRLENKGGIRPVDDLYLRLAISSHMFTLPQILKLTR